MEFCDLFAWLPESRPRLPRRTWGSTAQASNTARNRVRRKGRRPALRYPECARPVPAFTQIEHSHILLEAAARNRHPELLVTLAHAHLSSSSLSRLVKSCLGSLADAGPSGIADPAPLRFPYFSMASRFDFYPYFGYNWRIHTLYSRRDGLMFKKVQIYKTDKYNMLTVEVQGKTLIVRGVFRPMGRGMPYVRQPAGNDALGGEPFPTRRTSRARKRSARPSWRRLPRRYDRQGP